MSAWRDSRSSKVWQTVSGYSCRSAMITLHSHSTALIYSNSHRNPTKSALHTEQTHTDTHKHRHQQTRQSEVKTTFNQKHSSPITTLIATSASHFPFLFSLSQTRVSQNNATQPGSLDQDSSCSRGLCLCCGANLVINRQKCSNPHRDVCHLAPNCEEGSGNVVV